MWVPILIAVLMVVGTVIHEVSNKNDTAAEQLVEAVLKVEGVTYDFSEEDKAAEPKPE